MDSTVVGAVVKPGSNGAGAGTVGGTAPAKLFDHLYIGDLAAASDSKVLDKLQVRHILNMASESPNYFEEPNSPNPRFIYLKPPHHDVNSSKFSKLLISGVTFIESARKQNSNVLIQGTTKGARSATMAICYVMYSLKLRLAGAQRYILSRWPRVREVDVPERHLLWFQSYLDDRGHFVSRSRAPSATLRQFTAPSLNASPRKDRSASGRGSTGSEDATPRAGGTRTSEGSANLSIRQFMQSSGTPNEDGTVVSAPGDRLEGTPTHVLDARGNVRPVVTAQPPDQNPCSVCTIL